MTAQERGARNNKPEVTRIGCQANNGSSLALWSDDRGKKYMYASLIVIHGWKYSHLDSDDDDGDDCNYSHS